MSDNYEAARVATDIYRRTGAHRDVEVDEAIRLLASHGIWSMAQIAAITGARMSRVVTRVEKHDRTGGKFNPDTLDLIMEEFSIRELGQVNDALTAKIVQLGTSVLMLSRLLGVDVGKLKVQIARYQRQLALSGGES